MRLTHGLLAGIAMLSLSAVVQAKSDYRGTVALFRDAGQSDTFFRKSYAYAVFPTIGEGSLGVGVAHGVGHVYVHGRWVGNVTMSELSIGFQAAGKEFSQIIFFEDQRALDEFESGSFVFGADASVVAITAGASASTSTDGNESGASGGMHDAVMRGNFYKGMAVFTIPKGGLMGQVSVEGEKFAYSARQHS
jgi:lipid-binding SYLF domain-containing protein